MAKKYRLYECPFNTLPKNPRSIYSHYENGRMLVFYPFRKPHKEWRLLSDKEITKLSAHEKRWYFAARNEVNAKYLQSDEAQEEMLARAQRLLEIYESNLKQIQRKIIEDKNAEHEKTANG